MLDDRVTVRCTDDERQAWETASAGDARKLPDWIRLHLNRAAGGVGAEPPAASDGDDAA